MSDLKSVLTEVSPEYPTSSKKSNKYSRKRASIFPARGLKRELLNLISTDDTNVDAYGILDVLKTRSNKNFDLTNKRPTRKYHRVAFTNEARADGLVLRHWVREDKHRVGDPYPFSQFKGPVIPQFSNDEYNSFLTAETWTLEETRYFMELCTRFNLRWPIVHDRYDFQQFGNQRTIEDLKSRYWAIAKIIFPMKNIDVPITYNAERDAKRRQELTKKYSFSEADKQQLKKEKMLRVEKNEKLKEQRRSFNLEKLLTIAKIVTSSENQLTKQPIISTKKFDVELVTPYSDFNKYSGAATHLRSQEFTLNAVIHIKKAKAINQAMRGAELVPSVFTNEIIEVTNELRGHMSLLYDLRSELISAVNAINQSRTDKKNIEFEQNLNLDAIPEHGYSMEEIKKHGLASSRRFVHLLGSKKTYEETPMDISLLETPSPQKKRRLRAKIVR